MLYDIFNPQSVNSLEIDSVFQLKRLCQDFYNRKGELSHNLIASLDSMSNERPQNMSNKKKHFNVADKHGVRKEVSLDWMRLSAECDRLSKFKNVVSQSAIAYYSLLEDY